MSHADRSPGGIVEICAEGLASALAAGEGGADRVELCESLAIGGVTPGPGAIAVACDRLAIPVQVLVRPRGGDFVYGRAELEAMRLDILVAKKSGASGVVLGVLDGRGAIDRDRVARLVDVATPMTVTFHKAFDALADPIAGLEVLIALGVDRVLTSGGAAMARLGVARLAELVQHASGRIAILAGGRVSARDLAPLVAAGLAEIHAGSAVAENRATNAALVRRFVASARDAFATPTRASSGTIWHLAPRADWDRAVASGSDYRPGSLEAEGFVHFSEIDQVAESARLYYLGQSDLVAIEVDPANLRTPLVWEHAPERGRLVPSSLWPARPVRGLRGRHAETRHKGNLSPPKIGDR